MLGWQGALNFSEQLMMMYNFMFVMLSKRVMVGNF